MRYRRNLRLVALSAIAGLIGAVLTPGTAFAAPTIATQPASQVVALSPTGNLTAPNITLSVVASKTNESHNLTYLWFRGAVPLTNDVPTDTRAGILGATDPTLVIDTSELDLDDPLIRLDTVFGYYSVVVTEKSGETVVGTATSTTAIISPDQMGPMNVGALPTSAAEVNFSGFVEFPSPPASAKPSGATMLYDATAQQAKIFYLPGMPGTAFWFKFPQEAPGARSDTCAVESSKVAVTWTGDIAEDFCIRSQPRTGASISVSQVAQGSLSIAATVITPKFPGMIEPLIPNDSSLGSAPYSVNFQVFDDATGAQIPIGNEGRSGWSATLTESGMLRTTDPLILPAGNLGKQIRVGALLYFYPYGYANDGRLPHRFAALSNPITIVASAPDSGGGDSPPAPAPAPAPAPEGSTATPTPVPVPEPLPAAPILGNPATVTASQLGAIPPSQLSLVPPAQFAQIDPAAFAALTPQQVVVLTPSQVNAIRPARAAQLSTQAVAAMSANQLAAMRPAAVGSLRSAALRGLSPGQLSAVRPVAIARIGPANLAKLSVEQLKAFTPAQVRALTSAQRAALSPAQRRALLA